MLKEVIKKYLDEYFKVWNEERESLPKVSYEEERYSDLYVGKEDENENIQWKYKLIETPVDFNKMEKRMSIVIPWELKEYYNSYRFLTIGGLYGNEHIDFYPIGDGNDINHMLTDLFKYGSKQMIRIGEGRWGSSICVKLETGEVIIYYNNQEYFLAGSLEEVFTKLKVDRESIRTM